MAALNEALLYDLNQLTYFEKSFPKSLAFEDFSNWFLPVIENHNISIEDKLNTSWASFNSNHYKNYVFRFKSTSTCNWGWYLQQILD